MNDKKHKKFKKPYDSKFRKHIKDLCQELRTTFFVGEYEMDVCWCNEESESGQEDRSGGRVVAEISTDFRYLEFTIHVRPAVYDYWKKGDDYKIGRALTHEFSHLLIDPLFQFTVSEFGKERWNTANDIRERQVQRVANVVWQMIPKNLWQRKIKKDGKSHKPKRK